MPLLLKTRYDKRRHFRQPNSWRLGVVHLTVFIIGMLVAARLFYWQIISAEKLQAVAQVQRLSTIEVPGERGKILTSDGFSLVGNQPSFLLFAYLPQIDTPTKTIAEKLAPLLAPKPEDIDATPSATLTADLIKQTQERLTKRLETDSLAWVPLQHQINLSTKNSIQNLGINGLGFDVSQVRLYPEASMAAQLTGFVGKDENGTPKGYFGLEGYYDLELKGKPGIIKQEKDATGKPIVIGQYQDIHGRNGRTLITHINRGIQYILEKKLTEGLKRYEAKSGEIIVMDPKTGGILGVASFPSYDQKKYTKADSKLYRLPSISDSYEPGSTLKVIIAAAAIDEGAITTDTRCDEACARPITIGKYTIKTWNNEYRAGQTVREILEHSDNVGMVFIAQALGKDKLVANLKKFGFGAATNIDLEGETVPKLRDKWGDIDLATTSFGQGIAATSLQMLASVAALANGGELMEPQVVDKVIDGDKEIDIEPKMVRRVVSQKTAETMTDLMVSAVKAGEAKWVQMKGYKVAGKTGTAQIPISGHYDEEKTMASFIGFAPADNPKFVMLVKLREPQSSPWASETAAPLWMEVAKDLFYQLNIPPEN